MNFIGFLASTGDSSYPFVADNPVIGGLTLLNNWILDMQLVSGISSVVPDLTNDALLLTQVVADGSNVAFTFTLSNVKFVFTVARVSAVGKTTFQEAALISGGSTGPDLGFGFLQTGDLSGVPNGTYTGSVPVLRSRSCYLQNRQISRIRVANQTATVVANATCDPGAPEDPVPTIITADSHILDGDVKLMGGYNSRMTVDAESNAITVGAVDVTEQSEIIPCDVFGKFIYPEGVDPNTVDPCADLLFAINGVGPNPSTNAFTIHAASGITVQPRSAHALDIIIDQTKLFQSPYYEVGYPGQEFGSACNVGAWHRGTESFPPPTTHANDYDLSDSFTGSSMTLFLAFHSFGVPMKFKVVGQGGAGSSLYDSGSVSTSVEGTTSVTIPVAQSPIRITAERVDGAAITNEWYYRGGCSDATRTAASTSLNAVVTGVDGGFTVSAIPSVDSMSYSKTASGATTRVFYGGNRWWVTWMHLASKRTVVWTSDNRGITIPADLTHFYPPKNDWYVWYKNTGEKPAVRLSYSY